MLKQYDWPIKQTHEIPFQSFVTTLSTGFYIAFRGVFTPESRFAIVYTAFSYIGEFGDCFIKLNFFEIQYQKSLISLNSEKTENRCENHSELYDFDH